MGLICTKFGKKHLGPVKSTIFPGCLAFDMHGIAY